MPYSAPTAAKRGIVSDQVTSGSTRTSTGSTNHASAREPMSGPSASVDSSAPSISPISIFSPSPSTLSPCPSSRTSPAASSALSSDPYSSDDDVLAMHPTSSKRSRLEGGVRRRSSTLSPVPLPPRRRDASSSPGFELVEVRKGPRPGALRSQTPLPSIASGSGPDECAELFDATPRRLEVNATPPTSDSDDAASSSNDEQEESAVVRTGRERRASHLGRGQGAGRTAGGDTRPAGRPSRPRTSTASTVRTTARSATALSSSEEASSSAAAAAAPAAAAAAAAATATVGATASAQDELADSYWEAQVRSGGRTSQRSVELLSAQYLNAQSELEAARERVAELQTQQQLLRQEIEETSSLPELPDADFYRHHRFGWGRELRRKALEWFGIERFRPWQEAIMNATLARVPVRDLIVSMPTGYGKSLCFQLPALLYRNLTIVIEPLVSLMKDQMDQLQALPIDQRHVALLNEAVEENVQRAIFKAMASPDCPLRLLMVTPERFRSLLFRDALQKCYENGRLQRFVIDEVHCIVVDGNSFRPEYLELPIRLKEYPTVPVTGFSATLSPRLLASVMRDLMGPRRPLEVHLPTYRPNLAFNIYRRPGQKRRDHEQLARWIIEHHPKASGIVYTDTIHSTRDIAAFLTERLGKEVAAYNGKLGAAQRARVHERWSRGLVDIVVATTAFGMGINKRNVRFVAHASAPKSLDHYVQEAGRAGRDGQRADCVLFYDPRDIPAAFCLQARSQGGAIAAAALASAGTAGSGRSGGGGAAAATIGGHDDRPRGKDEFANMEQRIKALIKFIEEPGCLSAKLATYLGDEPGQVVPCHQRRGGELCDVCRRPGSDRQVDVSEAARQVLRELRAPSCKGEATMVGLSKLITTDGGMEIPGSRIVAALYASDVLTARTDLSSRYNNVWFSMTKKPGGSAAGLSQLRRQGQAAQPSQASGSPQDAQFEAELALLRLSIKASIDDDWKPAEEWREVNPGRREVNPRSTKERPRAESGRRRDVHPRSTKEGPRAESGQKRKRDSHQLGAKAVALKRIRTAMKSGLFEGARNPEQARARARAAPRRASDKARRALERLKGTHPAIFGEEPIPFDAEMFDEEMGRDTAAPTRKGRAPQQSESGASHHLKRAGGQKSANKGIADGRVKAPRVAPRPGSGKAMPGSKRPAKRSSRPCKRRELDRDMVAAVSIGNIARRVDEGLRERSTHNARMGGGTPVKNSRGNSFRAMVEDECMADISSRLDEGLRGSASAASAAGNRARRQETPAPGRHTKFQPERKAVAMETTDFTAVRRRLAAHHRERAKLRRRTQAEAANVTTLQRPERLDLTGVASLPPVAAQKIVSIDPRRRD